MRYFDANGLFLLEVCHHLLMFKYTKLGTVKISTRSFLFTWKKIYFLIYFYERRRSYLLSMPLCLHAQISQWTNTCAYFTPSLQFSWSLLTVLQCLGFFDLFFIFFWNFHFYFSSVIFVTLLLSCLLLVHFYFPGAPVMFRASIPLIYSQPLWITLQDRPVRFLSFPPPNFNVSGKRMVSAGFGVCCAQSADVPLWGKAMSCALILSTAEARVWYWTNSLSALH